MKPSHLRTPRTLDEGTFTPGYRPAQRDTFTERGHWVLNVLCVVALAVFIPLVVLGVA